MDYSKVAFSVYDYVIFALMLVFSASIGIYYRFSGGRQRTNKEYFLANRNMPILPVAFSLMASAFSAISILGMATENYMYGTQFVIITIGFTLGTPITALVFLPVLFQMQATSAFQYLEKRFCKKTRILASSIFIVQVVFYMAIFLYLPVLTLSAVTGLSKWAAVWSVGTVCTFYCTIGGMKAVLWTDVFQTLIMFSAVFAVIVKGTMDVGGVAEVWKIANRGERIQFFNFDPDPTVRHTVWTQAVGGIFMFLAMNAVNQTQIQRLLTVKSLKQSQKALFLSCPISILFCISASLAGLVVYANLANCDPLLRPDETNVKIADQILPYFVMVSLGKFPALPGLFVGGVFSASLSSMSSAINSLAAVTVEDFLRPLCFQGTSERRIAYFTKLIAFSYGVICIFLTFIVEKWGGVLQASATVINVIGGPLLGLFSLGMLFRRANSKGSMIGYIFSLLLCLWIGFGAMSNSKKIPSYHRTIDACPYNSSTTISELNDHNFTTQTTNVNWNNSYTHNSPIVISDEEDEEYIFPLYKLSYMWYSGIGCCSCILVGICASLLCGERKHVNPLLLSPLITRWSSKENLLSEDIPIAERT